jgi:tetratricopeptide (TPR) repeat protein
MSDSTADKNVLPPPSPDQRRIAMGQFERAQQVLAKGDHDYAIQLLVQCCKLDPANPVFRKFLRQAQKTKYKNNLYGSRLAVVTTAATKAKLRAAKRAGDHVKVLELAEEVLGQNPWDSSTQLDMAESFEALGLPDLAIWTLEQARQKDPKDVAVNKALAALHEKRGAFSQAIALWQVIIQTNPTDLEAQRKVKDLSASETIARGSYEEVAAGARRPGYAETLATSDQPADPLERQAAPLLARIEADPSNPSCHLHLASFYRRADLFDKAAAVLKNALGLTGNHPDVVLALAELEIDGFRKNLAIAERRLQANPDDEKLQRIRAKLVKEIDSRELDIFRQKADRQPGEKAHRFEVGVRLMRLGQLDEAIKELQALRSEPRFQWRALHYLGLCFQARKNWRLAQRNFEEALQVIPSDEVETRKEVLYCLAKGFADAGDLAKAQDFGAELANLDFSYRDIGKLLDEWSAGG